MKKILFLCALFLTTQSFAESFRFNYTGFEGRNRVFLSCSYAEGSAIRLLKTMGMIGISTRCSGGISPVGSYFPINLTVEFNFPVAPVRSEVKNSSFSSNCFFDTRFVKAFADKFENNLVVKKSRFHCFSSDSRYSFEIETL